MVRGFVRLAIGNIACRPHDEIGLPPKTRARCRMFAYSPLVTVVSVPAVIGIDVPYILLLLLIPGRRIAIIDWCS
jgi:hypothetical protein